METVSKNIAELNIAGKNVTADVSPYISRITYTDKEEAESDDIAIVLEDTAKVWQKSWYPSLGDTLTLKIGYPDNLLDCGLFEIDETEFELPPDMVTIKAIGAAISKELRTKNSKAYEKQTLKKIAEHIATKHGLKLIGTAGRLEKINIERKTQDNQTDIAFLSSLAKEYDLLFSVRGSQLVFITVDELDSKAPVSTIDRKQVSKARFTDKTSHIYAGALVSKRDTRSNSVKKWDIKSSGNPQTKDILIVNTRVETDAQAQEKAEAALKAKNREKITGSITIPGNPSLVAGVNISIADFGEFSGKWHIISSTHNVDAVSGYTTDLNIRKVF
ncbi:hypothetical protein LJB95_00980 [Paludibacteraceae bacterium OttesenSCG-928-F17]|nr:hypothetical protein [Paludibacteraceae bacterium OttesenSCG-928-F17]